MASHQVPQPHTTAWQFCLSCGSSLLFSALWLALAAVLVMQCYVATISDVPVPAFVLRRLETQLAAENLEVRFGHASFAPAGRLLLEKVELRSRAFEEPLLSSRFVLIHKSLWSILAGHRLPDDVRLEGAVLRLPAMLSPSGQAEPLISDLGGELSFAGGQCIINDLSGQIGNLSVSLSGSLAPPRDARGTPLTVADTLGHFLQYGRRAALEMPELQAAEHPALFVDLTPLSGGGMNVALRFTAESVHQPAGRPLYFGPLSITGHWIWDGVHPHPLQVHFATRSIEGPNGNSATNVRASLVLEPGAEPASFGSVQAHIAAAGVRAWGETLDAPVLEGAYFLHERHASFDATWRSRGEMLHAAGQVDLARNSAALSLSGRVPPALVTNILSQHAPKLEPYFRFGDRVDVRAAVTLAAGWRFTRLDSSVLGGRLDSHDVAIDYFRGQIDVDADLNFLAHDAFVVAGANEARGSYGMNFRTLDYRMLLRGRLRPPDIGGWFRGRWWPDFWQNFSFPVAPPQADVDVAGRWTDSRLTSYFGETDALGPQVLGADFERAHTLIFLRPQFTHVLDLAVERAGGTQRAAGWFERTAEDGDHKGSRLEYDLAGNLDPAVFAKLGGAKTAGWLEYASFTQPPQVHLWGRTSFVDTHADNDLHFVATAAGPLELRHFPVEKLAVAGSLKGEALRLDQVDFQVAGGTGSGHLSLAGPEADRQLALDVQIKDADLARSILTVEKFEAERTGAKGTSLAQSKFIKRASGGKLELAATLQGNPALPADWRGSGSAQISGAVLGEIQLFGLLSQVLSAVSLNFSSLKLEAARTSFQLADGRLRFPDIKITGPSAVIDAKGDYLLANQALDFTARLKPYQETRNPLAAVVGVLIDPIASIFELKLTGALTKPSWSVVLGSSGKPAEPEKKPVTPTPVAPAATTSASPPAPVEAGAPSGK